MSLFNVVHVAGSAMLAQTTRLNVISSNLSNQDSRSTGTGEAYKAKQVVFEAITKDYSQVNNPSLVKGGVRVSRVIESDAPMRKEFLPDDPNADEKGFVTLPNVNPIDEMANMLSASRAYQDSIQLFQTAKTMMQKTIASMEVRG